MQLIEQRLEKYAKKLIGRTDLEDALKRLENLARKEAWMGIAQNLKATQPVGESVRDVVDKAIAIETNVAAVDDSVAGADNRAKVVDDRVTAEGSRGA